mmetsp:Transcript_119765/g.244939  ORF Transcript_119765/g.244939 Transcript_119765/m.244939 type:complete len:207 (+) Transcript_119765:162-782(+)
MTWGMQYSRNSSQEIVRDLSRSTPWKNSSIAVRDPSSCRIVLGNPRNSATSGLFRQVLISSRLLIWPDPSMSTWSKISRNLSVVAGGTATCRSVAGTISSPAMGTTAKLPSTEQHSPAMTHSTKSLYEMVPSLLCLTDPSSKSILVSTKVSESSLLSKFDSVERVMIPSPLASHCLKTSTIWDRDAIRGWRNQKRDYPRNAMLSRP